MREYLVEEELEHYRFGWITRREFIRRAVLIGVSVASASAMVQSVKPSPVAASSAQASPFHVDEDDRSVSSQQMWYTAADGTQIFAYEAWPADAQMDASHPGVVVIHQNTGLVPQIMDVARRFAKQGYMAIAPDLISRVGPPALELSRDARAAAYSTLDAAQSARDAAAALQEVKGHPAVDPTKLAATGYCAGGGIIWRLTEIAPELTAAAPFYGSNPPLEAVPNIRAAILAVYGGLDERTDAGIPAIREALDAAGVTYDVKIYPDSRHAFFDDSGNPAYNPVTAVQAWVDTLNWFAQHLRLGPPNVDLSA